MDPIEIRFHPESLANALDLPEQRLFEQLRALLRSRHPRPADDPHEGPPQEGIVIRRLVRPRVGGVRVEFTYLCDRAPNSRYDKSEQAKGELTLDPEGAPTSTKIGPLRR